MDQLELSVGPSVEAELGSRDFSFKTVGICIKIDEFCIKIDELCIKNDELCIKNDELCITNDEFCIKNDAFNANVQELREPWDGADLDAQKNFGAILRPISLFRLFFVSFSSLSMLLTLSCVNRCATSVNIMNSILKT